MRVLVTGAGMVGCYLARELTEAGDEVTLFELNPVMPYIKNVVDLNRVKVVRGNILNLPDLMHALKDSGAEWIVHTAALLGASVNLAPFTAVQVNINGVVNVIEAAQLSGVKRIVYTSTGGVYKRKATAPMKEDHPLESSSLYNASKVSAELLGLQYSNLLKVEFIIIRYPVGYGPTFSAKGSIYGGIIEDLVRLPAAGKPVVVKRTQPFTKLNEYIYMKDMAHGAALALKAEGLKDKVFNIASEVLTDLEDLAAVVRKLIPKAEITIEEPVGPLKPDPTLFPMDNSRAREQLGYEPKYLPAEGLKDYLAEIPKVLVS